MANILQQVITYQMSGLALLENENCFIATANTKFKNFQDLIANLGDTVSFDLPPRMVAETGLVVGSFQGVTQRVQNLVCGESSNVNYAFTAQEFIFNVDDYMERFGASAIAELGASIEADVASVILSHTYRFYGNGVTPINSFTQLAEALAFYRNYGSPKVDIKGYLDDLAVPAIIGSGLNQFATNRNNEIAMSWEVGPFSNCTWYQSNLLPTHQAGNVGINATTLTVVSINGAGDQITFSGAGVSDPDAIKANDLLQFQDGVSGQTDLRYLTFIGHKVSGNPVQVRATANAASTGGGQVVVSIFPALISTAGLPTTNINTPIVAGQQAKALPSHRRGMICGGSALFLAMPRLPDQNPFPTANEVDPDTGVSIRLTYGATFGQNQMGLIHDAIWGKTLVDEYTIALIFPL